MSKFIFKEGCVNIKPTKRTGFTFIYAIIFLIISVSIITSAVDINNSLHNETLNESFRIVTNVSIEEAKFAQVINNVNIRVPEINRYLEWYNNFSDLDYEVVSRNRTTILKVGALEGNIRGYVIANEKYVIDPFDCDKRTYSCEFQINGVRTGKLSHFDRQQEPKEFNINNDYKLVVNDIYFDYCDGKKVCDYYYEAYNLVSVTLIVEPER